MKNTYFGSKQGFFAFCFLVLSNFLFAQQSGSSVSQWLHKQTCSFQQVPLMTLTDAAQERSDAPENATYLAIDAAVLQGLHQYSPDGIRLKIPTAEGYELDLLLARTQILSSDFKVTLNDGQAAEQADYPPGTFYRGIVNGDENSVVALTVFGDEVSAMILTEGNNLFLEKNGVSGDNYLLYHKEDAENPNMDIDCQSLELPAGAQTGQPSTTDRGVGCKVVQIFFECDFQLYLDKGSSTASVTSYVSALFSQIATLYANENIEVQISTINVWTTTDPYAAFTSTGAILNAFLTNTGTNFTGNLAHFLTTRSLGGGVAYVDVLCNKSYAFGVSQIYTTYSNVPAYSWSVEVVAHELGHNFGAWHTHSCNWPGGAIDNCYAPEGTCSAGPAPTNGGSIMSYCHLTSTGINFANGFGTTPGNHIRSKVLAATCLAQSGAAPTTFSTTNIAQSSASLNWGTVTGAANYTVQYKTAAASTWTSAGIVTTNTLILSGLSAGLTYNWQVKTDCSNFSESQSFTTNTGTSSCSAPVSLNTTSITSSGASLVWGAVSGATSYTVQYKTSSASTWITAATVSTTNYNLAGLTAGTSYNWKVMANCSAYSSTITFTTTTASSSCSVPGTLTSSNVASTTATVSWAAVSGATNYTVQYKKSSNSTWTTAGTVTSNTYNLTGLTASTAYNWKVKANCSAYTANQSFTTTASGSGSSCSAPTNLLTTNIMASSATLSWTAVSGATSYTVQYKRTNNNNYITAGTVTGTSYQLTGLTNGKSYNWKVKANCSVYSTVKTFTTPSQLVTGGPILSEDEGIAPSEKALVLAPNPVGSNSELKLRFNREIPENAQLIMADPMGKIIRQMPFSEQMMSLQVADLPYGIYTISIIKEGQRIANQRFTRIE